MLFKQHDNTSPLNSTLYAMSYPQNGDHIVAVDFMTSFHPMYSLCSIVIYVFSCCSLLSPHSCPKESKQSSVDRTMDASGKVKLHIANVPYEMKWQELKDLLRDKGNVHCVLP